MRKIALTGAIIVSCAAFSASPLSINWSATQKTFTLSQDKAVAAVGKPLSAGSVAGVHRRQERRQHTSTTLLSRLFPSILPVRVDVRFAPNANAARGRATSVVFGPTPAIQTPKLAASNHAVELADYKWARLRSAFGAKRKSTGKQNRLDPSKMSRPSCRLACGINVHRALHGGYFQCTLLLSPWEATSINRYDRTRMGELSRSPAGPTEFSIHSPTHHRGPTGASRWHQRC